VDFRNTTALDSERLRRMLLRHTAPYRHDGLMVRVRYSRGAEFSGSCYYQDARIFVNVGRTNRYPYRMATHIARAHAGGSCWWRESYWIRLADAYQLTLFVYLHELYHFLVKIAGRSPRRKEAMCDRFAARVLVDEYGCSVCQRQGGPVPRVLWDFQDLESFVAAAPRQMIGVEWPRPPIPVVVRGCGAVAARSPDAGRGVGNVAESG
jgi:hypothetical protein